MRNTLRLFIVMILGASVATAAQAPNIDQESNDRSRRGALEEKAAQAAAEATVTADIPFADILKAPGDIELNERFAVQQIRRGDLRGAATTLERVLLLAPGRDRTRMLYAAVLYRLDDAADAGREIELLLARPLPDDLKAEAAKYKKLVAASQRRTHFDARLSLGYGYDDNRNAGPDSDQKLFFGSALNLSDGSKRKQDTNVQFAGSVGASREVGGARGHSVFARIGYYRGEQTVVNILDLQAYSASLGGVYHTRLADFTPTLGFDHVLLSRSTYLRSFSQGLRVSRRLTHRAEVWGSLTRDDQGFIRTPLIPLGDERQGDQYDLSLGGAYLLTASDRLTATLGHRRKQAKMRYYAYRRESLGLEYTRLLGRGMFAVVGLTADFDRYASEDATVSPVVRHDDALTGQLLFGAPLSLLWKPLDAFTGTLGYERFQQRSNLLNYQYKNDKLTALLTYKWGI